MEEGIEVSMNVLPGYAHVTSKLADNMVTFLSSVVMPEELLYLETWDDAWTGVGMRKNRHYNRNHPNRMYQHCMSMGDLERFANCA